MATLLSLNDTLGTLFIGAFISSLLYGLALHQAYQYFVNYPCDKLSMKLYVISVLILETLSTALTMHVCYFYAVTNFNNIDNFAYISWSASALPTVGTITVVVTQCFFMYRVWVLGPRYRYLVVVAIALVTLEFGMCITIIIESVIHKTWVKVEKWTWFISVDNACATVADSLTIGVLTYTLHKSRTGLKRTDSMINILILYAVSTGFITGVYNVLSLVFILALPHNLVYYGTMIVGVKLYSNSLLAALNSRQLISARLRVSIIDTSPFGISVYNSESTGRSAAMARQEVRSQVQFRHNSGDHGIRTTTSSRDAIELKTIRNLVPDESFRESDSPALNLA